MIVADLTSASTVHGRLAFLSNPPMRSVAQSLRSLTLCLLPKEFDFTFDKPPPFHHCGAVSRLPNILPQIEYLNLTIPSLCDQALKGEVSRPNKHHGTFILSITPTFGRLCEGGNDPPSTTMLSHFQAAQKHFAPMTGWDVQIHVEAYVRQRCVQFRVDGKS